ncbi:trafficking regulator of GLUT4 1-like [Dreissena polymorpha]|uniref:Uncharacterized protein n=1 Tax=Dreissena polymorpha TaxID=45954 RepID=A0A9D4K3Y2_DREPO|nr:trafficking regulator of GLUT4 1-like [Dreissena polymorpha]KAH3832512.1 hypothetical protein DPMN_105802 [Dreissena polymorpha]
MAEAKGVSPAYETVPPQSLEGYGYDQGYNPNCAPAGRVNQSSSPVLVINQPTQNMVCVVQERPPDYTCLAIFSCLCCFWPLGLVAIILAIQATSLSDTGHYDAAKRLSNTTLGFIITSIIIGIACIVVFAVIYTGAHRSY